MPQPVVTITYTPCSYCGCIAECACPVPSAPMERAYYRAVNRLDGDARAALTVSLATFLAPALEED